MKINLSERAIFPIVVAVKGGELVQVKEDLDTGYDNPGTIQGEGKLMGTSCLFVRTSSCNIRCCWLKEDGTGSFCDTPYTSFKPQKNGWQVQDVIDTIVENTSFNGIKHVVISGGEPTMQTLALGELLQGLIDLGYHTTIETNATIYDPTIARNTCLVSMSPKLSSSVPTANKFVGQTTYEYTEKWERKHEELRKQIDVIQSYIDSCYVKNQLEEYTDSFRLNRRWKDFQLKFVVSSIKDIEEIENDFLAHLTNWHPNDVCLMPEGTTTEEIMSKSGWIINECVKRGWRFSTRLHTLIWGNKVGV